MAERIGEILGATRFRLRPSQIIALSAVTLLMLAVAVRFSQLSYDRYMQELRTDVVLDLISLREELEEEVFSKLLLIEKLAVVVAENPDLGQEEFTETAARFTAGSTGIVSMAVSRDMVVRMIYPAEGGNSALVGYDYRTNPEQAAQIRRARDGGETIVVEPTELVQGGTGLILRKPIFLPDGTLWGVASLVLDYEDFAARVSLPERAEALDLLIYEEGETGLRTLYGTEHVMEHDPVTTEIDFPGSRWHLGATPTGGWPASSPTALRDGLIDGAVILLLVALLAYLLHLAEARRLAQVRLFEALEAMDDGFALFDKDERLVTANSRYKDLYDPARQFLRVGERFEAIIRTGVAMGHHPDAAGREEEWIRDRLAAFRGVRTYTEQVLSNGKTMKVADRRTSDGGTVGLRVEVTELKQAKEAAEEANRAKTRFISVLSHELRTPLTVILGNVRLTRNFERTRAGRELLAAIEDPAADRATVRARARALITHTSGVMEKLEVSGSHLLSLINEMLDFAKIESGTLSVEVSACSIRDIVGPVEDQMRPAVEQKGLHFSVEACDCNVLADEGRTRQILYNLLGNALKFTETGRIALKVEAVENEVRFIVEDTGPGIEREDLERVFEAFQQADSSLSRNSGGTGLGLAISRQLAHAQGGSLELESIPGDGSRFTLALPRTSGLPTREADTAIAA